ncbi:MAG: ArsR/SmtB family transcription factor [Gaiellaceae bacterium]
MRDQTRLRALKLIAQRPRSTQELGPLVGISQAVLSNHLRILARADVLETAATATTSSTAWCRTASTPSRT